MGLFSLFKDDGGEDDDDDDGAPTEADIEAAKLEKRHEVGRFVNGTMSKAMEKVYETYGIDRAAAGDMERITAIFEKFDADGNGAIDKQELQNIMSTLDPAMSALSVEVLFKYMDTSGDGFIDYEDFVAFVFGAPPPPPPEPTKKAKLKKKMKKKVLKKVLATLFAHYGLDDDSLKDVGRVTEVMKEWDTDGDGCISRSEFDAGLSPLIDQIGEHIPSPVIDIIFRTADADQDGVLDVFDFMRFLGGSDA